VQPERDDLQRCYRPDDAWGACGPRRTGPGWARRVCRRPGRPATYSGWLAQTVPWAQASQQRLTAEHLTGDTVRVGNKPAGDGHVDRAVDDRAGEVRKPHPLQAQLDAGGLGGQSVAQVRAEDRGCRRGDARPHRAGVARRDPPHSGLGGGRFVEDDLGPAATAVKASSCRSSMP
jgi:hypothetical protein